MCCFNQIESAITMLIRTTTIGVYPKPEYVSILHVSPTYLTKTHLSKIPDAVNVYPQELNPMYYGEN